jgi:hypothetical protein
VRKVEPKIGRDRSERPSPREPRYQAQQFRRLFVGKRVGASFHAGYWPPREAGAVRNAVGIWFGAFSGNMKVSFQATRSIG